MINIPNDKKEMNQRITEIMMLEARVCEMSDAMNAIGDINVPVDPRIDINVITADDPDPKFVNVEVLRAGVISKVNRRRYNNNIVREVNELTPGVQGFLGHPDPSKEGFEFRKPQCIFVGSMVDHMPDGLDRCIAKAYLFKSSDLREWIPKSIAAGNPMTVSINATGDIIRNDYGDGWDDYIIDVVHISELTSIDWANPGTEGVETSQALSVVKEMQNKGGNDMADVNHQSYDPKEIIKSVTVTELKAYNTDSYNGVLKGATVQELQAQNPAVVEQIIKDNQITEMSLRIDGKDEKIKIQEMQATVDKFESEIADLKEKLEESKITELRSKLLNDMVPEQYREKIGARISGKDESEIKKSIETEISYIREMGGSWNNLPVGRQQQTSDDDELKASIASMFGHKENKED